MLPMTSEVKKTPDHSVSALLALARQRLSHLDNPRLDAEYLLAHAIGQSRTWLLTWPDKSLNADSVTRFDTLVRERAIGMPLAYLTGEREFWSMQFQVSPDTLIPRPETETLVELALKHSTGAEVIMDLGTGSGAIAIALASELPGKSIVATDLNAAALTIAHNNVQRHRSQITLVQSDWLTGFAHECANLIVANPPYIAAGDSHLSGDGVLFEPVLALSGGTDGLDAYRKIVPQAARCLRPSGTLVLEHGHDQAAAIRELMAEAGYGDVGTFNDTAGLQRICIGKRLPAQDRIGRIR